MGNNGRFNKEAYELARKIERAYSKLRTAEKSGNDAWIMNAREELRRLEREAKRGK